MYNELREEEIVRKVGGRFKLSTLIQKRMMALNRGCQPLVDLRTDDKMAIIIAEIMQDKIFLDTNNEIKVPKQVEEDDIVADMGFDEFH